MSKERNIKLVVEYDGTDYAGWQAQPGLSTVQGELLSAVERFTGASCAINGASRTDSGVHAMAQVLNFTTSADIPLTGIMPGLNTLLPPDIKVKEASSVPFSFDARRDAKSKTYIYKVFNGGYRTALSRRYSWSVERPLDTELMRKGAGLFMGKKNYASFMAAGCDSNHPVREILSFRVQDKGDGFIEFEVKGTAFLRHMVRIMAGTLVTLGMGRITQDDITAIIEARDRIKAPLTAPPQGLFLKKVEY